MKKKIVIIILLVLTLACVIPGVSAPQSIPTADTRLDLIIAETVSAAQTQTQQVLPAELATATSTLVPTNTPSPVFSIYNSALVKQVDGSTLFIDRTNQFQITFPNTWLVFRPNHDEYYSIAVDEAINDYPFLLLEMDVIKDQDPNKIRVHGYSIQPGLLQEQYTPHISIVWADEPQPLEDVAIQWVEYIKSQDPNVNVVTLAEKIQNQHGISMVISDFEVSTGLSRVDATRIYPFEKRIYFNVNTTSVLVVFSGLVEVKEILNSDFEQLINSIELLEP